MTGSTVAEVDVGAAEVVVVDVLVVGGGAVLELDGCWLLVATSGGEPEQAERATAAVAATAHAIVIRRETDITFP